MSKETSKRKNALDRQKQFKKKRRESRSISKNPDEFGPEGRSQTDVRKWPIVRAYVPVEDVFRATGFGSAGIVRAQPNQKLRYTFVMISLLDGGIKSMFGKDDTTQEEIDTLLEKLGFGIPPYQIGQPELATRHIWGAHALALDSGFIADAKWMRYLSIVPALSGSRNWWLQQFIGPQGLADPKLVEFLERNPTPDGIPEDKEVFAWTTATFACSNTNAVRTQLRRSEPEFIDEGEDEDGADCFTWTRAYPKNHWSPLSLLGGRQTLGSVRVHSDRIVADSKVLSMASILFGKLKAFFGDDIRLTDAQWSSSDDMILKSRHEKSQDQDDND